MPTTGKCAPECPPDCRNRTKDLCQMYRGNIIWRGRCVFYDDQKIHATDPEVHPMDPKSASPSTNQEPQKPEITAKRPTPADKLECMKRLKTYRGTLKEFSQVEGLHYLTVLRWKKEYGSAGTKTNLRQSKQANPNSTPASLPQPPSHPYPITPVPSNGHEILCLKARVKSLEFTAELREGLISSLVTKLETMERELLELQLNL